MERKESQGLDPFAHKHSMSALLHLKVVLPHAHRVPPPREDVYRTASPIRHDAYAG